MLIKFAAAYLNFWGQSTPNFNVHKNEQILLQWKFEHENHAIFILLFSHFSSVVHATSCVRMKIETCCWLSFSDFSFRFYWHASTTLWKTCGGVAGCRLKFSQEEWRITERGLWSFSFSLHMNLIDFFSSFLIVFQ